jgi:hypothetical protein
MLSYRQLTVLLALSVCLAGVSCRRTHASAHVDSRALLQIVRDYNPGTHASPASAAAPRAERTKISTENLQTEQEYESPIKQDFSQGKFDQLEKAATEARTGKGRIIGGAWKLYVFYDAIGKTFIRDQADESDWKIYFDTLKQWIAAKPESAAARLSLAHAYMAYAWDARGHGYADSVTDKGWELFGDRIATASATLAEAARLKEKDPYWYELMQMLALDQGWDKSQARELLEQAAASEPGYYHYYREYANFLQPRWYGEEGEVEAFAEEISNRVGGQEGDFIYFEIASLLACQCDPDKNALQSMSWPKIKLGYAALEQLYGVSDLKRNRFASMAVKAGDKPAAREAFVDVGDNWDKSVWVSNAKFEYARTWAKSE